MLTMYSSFPLSDSHRSYRPLLVTVFKLCVQTFGVEPNPIRFLCIFFHFLVSALTLVLCYIITGQRHVALISSLLFATHPVHVEALTPVNLAEPMCAFFYILSFLIYWRTTRDLQTTSSVSFCFLLLCWIITVATATLLKETGITITGLLISSSGVALVHHLLIGINKESSIVSIVTKYSWDKNHLCWVLSSICAAGAYIVFRKLLSTVDLVVFLKNTLEAKTPVFEIFNRLSVYVFSEKGSLFLGSSELIRRAENPFSFLTGWPKIFSYLYLHFRYFFLLVWPKDLCSEYAYNCIPAVETWTDYRNIYSFLMYFGLICTIIKSILLLAPQKGDELESHDPTPESVACEDSKTSTSCNKSSSANNEGYDSGDLNDSLSSNYSFDMSQALQLKNFGLKNIPTDTVCKDIDPSESNIDDNLRPNVKSHSNGDVLETTLNSQIDGEGCKDDNLKGSIMNPNSNPENDLIEEDFDSQTSQIYPEAYLISLAFLLVPFLPASGIFRLGTLLAERLLYLPSIGYCSLMGICIHNIACWFVPDPLMTTQSNIRKKQSIKRDAAKWLITMPIVYLYGIRTIHRNAAWRNDKTLFLSAYETCPNSAKLNLQLSKLRMNENNVTGARYHLDRARAIDPDFCDTGYEEALVRIVENQDYEGAIEAAAGNLQCIYSNMHSWELLSKIWESKLSTRPTDFVLYEEIADICLKAGITVVATKKFLHAARLAQDQKKHSQALRLSLKAEEALLVAIGGKGETSGNETESRFSRTSQTAKSSLFGDDFSLSEYVKTQLSCYVWAYAGHIRETIRASLSDHSTADGESIQRKSEKINIPKKYFTELARAELLLSRASHPNCAVVEEESKDISTNPIVAIHSLFGRYEVEHRAHRQFVEMLRVEMQVLTI